MTSNANPSNANLFAALRAGFPADLDAVAVETDDGLRYTWGDLDRASAMIANLFVALELEEGARIAVQVEKSVEALMLYLATLRAGYVFLPLNTAYRGAEIEYFIGNAEPAVVVCSSANADWVGPIALAAGTRHVFTLNDDRTGTLLDVAVQCSDRHAVAQRQRPDFDLPLRAGLLVDKGENAFETFCQKMIRPLRDRFVAGVFQNLGPPAAIGPEKQRHGDADDNEAAKFFIIRKIGKKDAWARPFKRKLDRPLA